METSGSVNDDAGAEWLRLLALIALSFFSSTILALPFLQSNWYEEG